MDKKREQNNVKKLKYEGAFIIMCMIIELFAVSIFFELLYEETTNWSYFTIISSLPSFFGTKVGLMGYIDEEIKYFNMLKISFIIAISIIWLIVTVFVTYSLGCDLGQNGWLMAIIVIIIVTEFSSNVASWLAPIWDS